MIWDIAREAVEWQDGKAYPAGPNAGSFEPLTLGRDRAQGGAHRRADQRRGVAQRARRRRRASARISATSRSIRRPGTSTILRYTAVQDVGRAIHPSYVEGQIQGGVAQGIGWALNEEYIYDTKGRMENPGFLDYRVSGRLRPADDRGGDGRGAQPAPSVRRARRRRGADRAADGRRRQRDPRARPGSGCAICRCRRRRCWRRSTKPPRRPDREGPDPAARRHLRLLLSRFHRRTGGVGGEGADFLALVRELDARFPGLGTRVEEGMAIAIDGVIYQDAYDAKLDDGSEIYLIPKIAGG